MAATCVVVALGAYARRQEILGEDSVKEVNKCAAGRRETRRDYPEDIREQYEYSERRKQTHNRVRD